MRSDNLFIYFLHSTCAHVKSWCDTGVLHYGWTAWVVTNAVFVAPVLIIYLICQFIHPFLGLLLNILILYLCMGFRTYNHYFSAIQIALLNGETSQARNLLGEWCDCDATSLETAEITRMAIEKALISVQKDVFGIIFWFVMPLGPAGALLYRVSSCLENSWNGPDKSDRFGVFAKKIFYWIDWIPVRLTAITFAIVGNFEDAIFAWRQVAKRWKNRNTGILLASAGGAMGVRLGTPYERAIRATPLDLHSFDTMGFESEMPGEEPKIRYLQSAIGLIWRALLLWLLILFFFKIAFNFS